MDVVGPALLASATGQGHRKVAAGLGLPAGTVRGWVRRAGARAEWLRARATVQAHAFDPMLPVINPAASPLADALEALGMAASAVVRHLGPIAPPWHLMAMLARGQLLTPLRSG
jgi:hypothetical protein